MQPVLLAVLEVAGLAQRVLRVAEVEEASVGEESRGVGPLVDRWSTDFLQREAGQHSRLRQDLARVFVGDRHDDEIRNLQARAGRIGTPPVQFVM